MGDSLPGINPGVLHQEVPELRKMLNLTGQDASSEENLFALEAGQSHQKPQGQHLVQQKYAMNQASGQALAPSPQQAPKQYQEAQPQDGGAANKRYAPTGSS